MGVKLPRRCEKSSHCREAAGPRVGDVRVRNSLDRGGYGRIELLTRSGEGGGGALAGDESVFAA